MKQELICEEVYLSEMATIAFDEGLNINVNPETNNLDIAYFKVYNHRKVDRSGMVARLHFKDEGMEYHKRDPLGKQIWPVNSGDIKKIKNLLDKNHKTNTNYTNWQVLCFQWNIDNDLLPYPATIDDYFSGKYDHVYDNDQKLSSAYVPSTQEMPDTWIYDPPK